MEPLFPGTPRSSGAPSIPIGPTAKAEVVLGIDRERKSASPVATIERFDAAGGVIKIGLPSGTVTIDAAAIGGKNFPLTSETNVARMLVTGLVETFSRDRLQKEDLGLTPPENFSFKKDPTAISTARVLFGLNGSSETITIANRAALEGALKKVMSALGGTVEGSAAPATVDPTHPDALKNATAPTPAAVAAASSPAPAPKPAAAEVKISIPGVNPPGSAPKISVPVPPAPGGGVKLSLNRGAESGAPTPAAPTPPPSVNLKATQRIEVAPKAPEPMTPESLKLYEGIVFQTSSSGTERAIFVSGKTVFVFRKGSDSAEWSPEFRVDNAEHVRIEFSKKWSGGEVSHVPNRLGAGEISALRSRCALADFPELK